VLVFTVGARGHAVFTWLEQEAEMFIALELSVEIVRELKEVRARVAQFDRGL
jgi:hypothetical protein